MSLLDARPLRPVRAYGVSRQYPVRSRDQARDKPMPCVCTEVAHPFCWVVTCRCDHGIGSR